MWWSGIEARVVPENAEGHRCCRRGMNCCCASAAHKGGLSAAQKCVLSVAHACGLVARIGERTGCLTPMAGPSRWAIEECQRGDRVLFAGISSLANGEMSYRDNGYFGVPCSGYDTAMRRGVRGHRQGIVQDPQYHNGNVQVYRPRIVMV